MLNMYVLKCCKSVTCGGRRMGIYISGYACSVPGDDFFGTKDINGVPVKITLPPDMNCILGVIHQQELSCLSGDETCELLVGEDSYQVLKLPGKAFAIICWVISVRSLLAELVQLGWDKVKVKRVQPTPVRCYRCQHFGHMAADCKVREHLSVSPHSSAQHPDEHCKNNKKCPA